MTSTKDKIIQAKQTNQDRENILLVDDDLVSLKLLSSILEGAGYQTPLKARTGKDARRLFKKQPSLVVFDIELPDANGLKLLEEFRKHDQQITAIVISGSDNFANVISALETDAFWYLQKPINKKEFLEVVKRAAIHSSLLRQNSLYKKALRAAVAKKRKNRPELTKAVENEIKKVLYESTSELFKITQLNPDNTADNKSPLENDIKVLNQLSLAEIEQHAILETLIACEGNKAKAARRLGISEKSIYNKMRRFGISFSSTDTNRTEKE
jgi:DNA-binding NtrC family response regulator